MANSLILAGFGMAALGMSGRIAARSAPRAISNIENLIKSMPLQNWSKAWANSKYYKGGFQLKMTRREVSSVQVIKVHSLLEPCFTRFSVDKIWGYVFSIFKQHLLTPD